MSGISAALLKIHAEKEASKRKSSVLVDVIKKSLRDVKESYYEAGGVRCSQLYDFCPRYIVYSKFFPMPDTKMEKFEPNMLLRMSVGTFLHSYLQNEVLGPAGVLYGGWVPWVMRDVSSHPETKGFYPRDGRRWVYREPRLFSEEFYIEGHVDGLLCMNRMKAFLEGREITPDMPMDLAHTDFKSTDREKFKKVKEEEELSLPPYYRWQAVGYQRLLGVSKTVFLYLERNTFDMVAFEYAGDDATWEDILRKTVATKLCVENKVLPPRHRECLLCTSARAKECPWKTLCFDETPEDLFQKMLS